MESWVLQTVQRYITLYQSCRLTGNLVDGFERPVNHTGRHPRTTTEHTPENELLPRRLSLETLHF